MKNKNKNILTDYQNNIINIPSTVLPCHLTKRSARANEFINFMNFTNFKNSGVESIGVEPTTSCMPCKRSSQLS